MSTATKRKKTWDSLVQHNKYYAVLDALNIVRQTAKAKFDESVDVAVNLGIDAKKSDQTVRGSVVLPAGTGSQGTQRRLLEIYSKKFNKSLWPQFMEISPWIRGKAGRFPLRKKPVNLI